MSRHALWTSADIAAATGGRATGSWAVGGVAIDSRTVQAGELFIALAGPRHDGHDFLTDALGRGAVGLIHRRPPDLDERAPVVEVRDTMEALERLGRAGRARAQARIGAVTGSVGKTGTKEALRHVLALQGATHASAASHNNHWGVPLSLARMPPSSAYAVFELGMNAPGEIDRLSRQVRPHVALITAIAPAHIGRLGSIDGIADAKAEIFNGLEAGGCVILNAGSPQHGRLVARAHAAGCHEIRSFGADPSAHARLVDAVADPDGSTVTMTLGDRRIDYRIGVPGRHWVQNSIAVLAMVEALGADPVAAAAALATFCLPEARGQRRRLPWHDGWITLIDDSYNANPVSMRAAFDVLALAQGRKIAILGDMLELGEQAQREHADLAPALDRAGADLVFSAGPLMAHMHEALPLDRRGAHCKDALSLRSEFAGSLRAGDTVLVKGSLGSRMKVVVDAVVDHSTTHARQPAEG